MKSERNHVLKIRCTKETIELWKAYVAMSGHRNYEEALIDLLKKTGWLDIIKTARELKGRVF